LFLINNKLVERIRFYSEIENEAPWEKDIKPPPNWPTNASIVFVSFSFFSFYFSKKKKKKKNF